MKLTKWGCLAVLLSACTTIGGDDGPPGSGSGSSTPTAPPASFDTAGVVTAPRHGAVQPAGDVMVQGFYNTAGSTVTVERWDAPSHAWVTAATATTSTTATADGAAQIYAFQAAVSLSDAQWPQGGLVSLRARVGALPLPSLDSEPETQQCVDSRTTWHDRGANCASGVPSLTLSDQNSVAPSTHVFLDIKGTSSDDDAAAYYQTINAPLTVTDFLSKYGLDQPDTPTLTYYNLGDLATGREIRCRPHQTENGTGVACSTFNYGVFGSQESVALDDAVTGRAGNDTSGWFANVSMVYDPPITAPNAIKYMVYSGTTGALQDHAQLDTVGNNISVPNNCINCHGSDGNYDLGSHTVTGSRFLPFDPSAFVFSDQTGMTRADQEATMRQMNQIFLQAAPSDELSNVVRGWYGGGTTLAGAADTTAVPDAWVGPTTAPVYRNVVAVACRGCHASRGDNLAFATPDQFRQQAAAIINDICGSPSDPSHAMPSAEASLARFWAGPSRAYLAGFLGAEAMGNCTAPQ
jgi:hypothetical protein